MKIIIDNRTNLSKYKAVRLVLHAIDEQDKYEFDELRAHEIAEGVFISSVTNKQSIRYIVWRVEP